MTTRAGGPRLAVLCDRLHRLTRNIPAVTGPVRGRRFELAAERELLTAGFPVRAVAGGVEILGTLPASGLRHQIDAEAWCSDCDVIAEWKAYQSQVPKNDLLLFKAKTDDVYEALAGHAPRRRPIVRVFGIAGDATVEARRYAARHGIALVERSRWPAPVLFDPTLTWQSELSPAADELRSLRFLARPLQSVYRQTRSGRLVAPPVIPVDTINLLLRDHESVSRRLDREVGLGRAAA